MGSLKLSVLSLTVLGLMSVSTDAANIPRCEEDVLVANYSACGVGARQFGQTYPGLAAGLSSFEGNINLLGSVVVGHDPRGGVCPDMVVCAVQADPAGAEEYAFRRIVIDSGALSRDTRVSFNIDQNQAALLKDARVASLTIARVRFRSDSGDGEEQMDFELTVSPTADDGVLYVQGFLYNGVFGTYQLLGEAHVLGFQRFDISIKSAPNSTDEFLVTAQGQDGSTAVIADSRNIPVFALGILAPEELHYGNLAADVSSLSAGATQLITLGNWAVDMSEPFTRRARVK